MFNDVVEMLERIDSKEVDYIILLLCETQINENTDVIALGASIILCKWFFPIVDCF